MPDIVRAIVHDHGLGTPDRVVELSSVGKDATGTASKPYVCTTDRGVWLICAGEDGNGTAVDLTTEDVRIEASRLRADVLFVGEERFRIPLGSGDDVRTAIGVGRLRRANRPTSTALALAPGRYFDKASDVILEWLGSALEADEIPLALLATVTEAVIQSAVLGKSVAPKYLLMTDRRSLSFAVSAVGDDIVERVPAEPLAIGKSIGRDTVTAGTISWQATLANEDKYAELAAANAVLGAERVRIIARLNWLRRGDDPDGLTQTLSLLTRVADSDAAHPLDAITIMLLPFADEAAGKGEPTPDYADAVRRAAEAVARMPIGDDTSSELAAWCAAWHLPGTLNRDLLASVLATAEADRTAWTVPWHRAVRELANASSKDNDERTANDVQFAEHLLAAGRAEEAVAILEARLTQIPDDFADVLPGERTALTETPAGQLLAIRLLDVLVLARQQTGQAADAEIARLARQQPLVPDRLESLRPHASTDLARRVDSILQMFAPGQFTRSVEVVARPSGLRSLAPDVLNALDHRGSWGSGMRNRAVAMIAKTKQLDAGTLMEYAEPASERSTPELMKAIQDSAVVLGIMMPRTYVSGGTRNIGIHLFEGETPILIVGAQHLDPESEWFLSGPELRFAVGAKLAHHRFHHVLVTAGEFTDGIWATAGSAASIALMLLPMSAVTKQLSASIGRHRLYSAVRSVVPLSLVKKATGATDGRQAVRLLSDNLGAVIGTSATRVSGLVGGIRAKLPQRSEMPGDAVESVSPQQGETLSFLRHQQVTADRVGLLLSDNLQAAVRAMFVTDPHLQRELAIAREHGLINCLSRQGADGQLALQGLAVRVSALLSFYLSEQYAEPRRAMFGS